MKSKLIVGLGNYPKEYDKTRHNVGFMVIDEIIDKLDLTKQEQKFDGLFYTYKNGYTNYLIAKPLTFMNNSGEFISKIMKYYKISIDNLLVICDDLDQKAGKIKIKTNSSSGGHNGLKSIISHLGSEDFYRVKIGIDKPIKGAVSDYVVGKFTKEESKVIKESIYKVSKVILDTIDSNKEFSKITF
jgi:PTH1 family peptidyl-tRNA hydrolase